MSKGEKVIGDWRKLRNEFLIMLLNKYSGVRKWRMEWAGNVARMGGEEKWVRSFGPNSDGKTPLAKAGHRREYNIKVDQK